MKSTTATPLRSAVALALAVWLAAGCSDSSDSSFIGDVGTGRFDQAAADPVTGESRQPTGIDPSVGDVTRVDVDITVPAYVSDALLVTLTWGATNATAAWIGDESWSATLELPSDEERPLRVTFLDRNGALTLATYEAPLRTVADGAQTLAIGADQFDRARHDDDRDGTSNLDEAIAGTDPFANGEALFGDHVRFDDVEKLEVIGRASGLYESELPRERPYRRQSEDYQPYDRATYQSEIARAIAIDIDATGNGRFSNTYRLEDQENVHIENRIATRDVRDGAVTWHGTDTFSDYSAALVEDIAFNVTTRRVDERTFRQQGTIRRSKSGDWSGGNFTIDMSYDLTGLEATGAPVCNPIAGTITYRLNPETYEAPSHAPTTTISSEPGDGWWNVSVTGGTGELVSEYRVQTLETVFHCGFGEL